LTKSNLAKARKLLSEQHSADLERKLEALSWILKLNVLKSTKENIGEVREDVEKFLKEGAEEQDFMYFLLNFSYLEVFCRGYNQCEKYVKQLTYASNNLHEAIALFGELVKAVNLLDPLSIIKFDE